MYVEATQVTARPSSIVSNKKNNNHRAGLNQRPTGERKPHLEHLACSRQPHIDAHKKQKYKHSHHFQLISRGARESFIF